MKRPHWQREANSRDRIHIDIALSYAARYLNKLVRENPEITLYKNDLKRIEDARRCPGCEFCEVSDD